MPCQKYDTLPVSNGAMSILFHKIHIRSMEQKKYPATECDVLVNELIRKRKWGDINRLLTKHAKSKDSVNLIADDCTVHRACQYRAPLSTIVKLSATFPSHVNVVNEHGQYPLHSAVANGCTPDVIQFFARSYPSIAGVQDSRGKTPLHYATECYAEKMTEVYSAPNNIVQNHLAQVVELLLEAAPQAVNVEDENESNPIESALLNYTHIKIIKAMQRASRKDWRTRKAQHHRLGATTA